VDTSDPVFDVLDAAFEEVTGRRTVRARSGGSLPIVPELAQVRRARVLTGIGLPDDQLHSPNEKLSLEQLWTGINVFGRFFELMGEREGQRRSQPAPVEEAVPA
jgi:acetylornithine deacetylase/succinyl-diaminopimelate desuccinylase-like protein